MPGEDYASIVTGDHFEMGKKAAELMSDAIGGAGKIGFIFHDAVYYVTNNRDDYARAAFEQLYPDIEIVAEQGFTDEGSTYEIGAGDAGPEPRPRRHLRGLECRSAGCHLGAPRSWQERRQGRGL